MHKNSEYIGKVSTFVLGVTVALVITLIITKVSPGFTFSKLTALFFPGKHTTDIQTAWKLPTSTQKGYPEVDGSQKLHIYNLETKKLMSTNISVLNGSGAENMGQTTPNVTKDLLYTAFIEPNSGQLRIISNETLEIVSVPNAQNTTYIVGWSPSGNKLVYYIEPKTVSGVKEGMMPEWNTVEKFDKGRAEGFYSLDVTTGESTQLTPVDNVVAVLSDDEVLTKVGDAKLVIFDTKNFIADYETVKAEFSFGTGQYDISQDSTSWAFISSNDPTKDMFISFTSFPNKDGTVVDSGWWADVQWPVISPNGTMVAYQKYEGVLEPGYPNPTTWLYQKVATDMPQLRKIGKGRPLAWIDNSSIVVEVLEINDRKLTNYKGILNTDTNSFEPFVGGIVKEQQLL